MLGCGPGFDGEPGWPWEGGSGGWTRLAGITRFGALKPHQPHPTPSGNKWSCTAVPTLLLPLAAVSPSSDIVIAIKIGA